MRLLGKYVPRVGVGAVVLALTAGVPASAVQNVDAHKLDGRHGVACDATRANRAGAYVATCPTGTRAGLLPNNIIRRAPNAAKLGGRTAADFDDAVTVGGRTPADFDDAETLQGNAASAFAPAVHTHTSADIVPPLNLTADVPGPGTAVVKAENTGTGVGVWGTATENAGVYGEATTGVGVWGRNNYGGIAMKAEGSAVQSAYAGGWAKALLRIQGDGTFVACYNGVTGSSTGKCGFTVTNNGGGNFTIDFGSGINTQYRFFSLSGSAAIILTGFSGTTGVTINVAQASYGYAYYIMVF